jgi:hypothetical protein
VTEESRNCLFEQRLLEVVDELDAILEANPDSADNKEPAHKEHVFKLLEDKLQAGIIKYEPYNEFSLNRPFYTFRLTAPNLYFKAYGEECNWGMKVPDYQAKEGEEAVPKNRNGWVDVRFQLDRNAKKLSSMIFGFSPRLNIPEKEGATYINRWPGGGMRSYVTYESKHCDIWADLGEWKVMFYQPNPETGENYDGAITGNLGRELDSIAIIKIKPVPEYKVSLRDFLERGALNAVFKVVGYHEMDKVVR